MWISLHFSLVDKGLSRQTAPRQKVLHRPLNRLGPQLTPSPPHSASSPKQYEMVESESLEVSSFELNAHKFDRYYCELRPSGVIVRFQIRKKLGHGAHGTVWKLEEDTGARRVRAIKVVKSRGEQTTPEVKSLIALNQVGLLRFPDARPD